MGVQGLTEKPSEAQVPPCPHCPQEKCSPCPVWASALWWRPWPSWQRLGWPQKKDGDAVWRCQEQQQLPTVQHILKQDDVTIPDEEDWNNISFDLCTMVYSWKDSMPWCSTEALALLTKYRIFKARLWPPLSGRQMADGCFFCFFWTCWYELGVMSRGLPQNAVFIFIF